MTLYDLSNELLAAMDAISVDETTGEVVGTELLDELDAAMDDKLEAFACYIKNEKALSSSIKAEEDALKARRQAKVDRISNLESRLAYYMTTVGKDKLETPKCKVSFRNSAAVRIDDENLIPDEFMTVKTERKPDKTALKKALQSGGAAIAGALLETRQNIQIK